MKCECGAILGKRKDLKFQVKDIVFKGKGQECPKCHSKYSTEKDMPALLKAYERGKKEE